MATIPFSVNVSSKIITLFPHSSIFLYTDKQKDSDSRRSVCVGERTGGSLRYHIMIYDEPEGAKNAGRESHPARHQHLKVRFTRHKMPITADYCRLLQPRLAKISNKSVSCKTSPLIWRNLSKKNAKKIYQTIIHYIEYISLQR